MDGFLHPLAGWRPWQEHSLALRRLWVVRTLLLLQLCSMSLDWNSETLSSSLFMQAQQVPLVCPSKASTLLGPALSLSARQVVSVLLRAN